MGNAKNTPTSLVHKDQVQALFDRIDALTKENERLREALRFYAEEDNWKTNRPCDPYWGGFVGLNKARVALQEQDDE